MFSHTSGNSLELMCFTFCTIIGSSFKYEQKWNFKHFCGNAIFPRFTFFRCKKDSSGMIIQSESYKFALRENLSRSRRTMIFPCSRSLDPRLFYLCLSLYFFFCLLTPVFFLVSFFSLPHEQRRRASPSKAFEVDSFVNRRYYCN